jgi:hypothetical protein
MKKFDPTPQLIEEMVQEYPNVRLDYEYLDSLLEELTQLQKEHGANYTKLQFRSNHSDCYYPSDTPHYSLWGRRPETPKEIEKRQAIWNAENEKLKKAKAEKEAFELEIYNKVKKRLERS